MAKGLITRAYLEDTADAIRVLRGESNTYTPDEFGEKIIDAIPDVEVSGAIVSVTDAAAYPAEGLEFAIEPVQDLHGYDKPWPGGGGKNLVDESILLTATGWSKTNTGYYTGGISELNNTFGPSTDGFCPNTTFKANTQYTISVTNYVASGGYINIRIYYTDETTEGMQLSTNTTVTNSTFTTAANKTVQKLTIGYMQSANGQVAWKDFQVEEGSTATSYEPYSNICPISGWTGVNGQQCGKNLLPTTEIVSGGFDSLGREVDNTTRVRTPYIAVKTTTYTISIPSNLSDVFIDTINFYDANKTFINRIVPINTQNKAFTVEQKCYYVRIAFKNSAGDFVVSDIAKLQLELGSTATSYEPYTGTSIPVTFPTEAGTVYGGKVDVVNGKLTVDRAEVDLGDLTWTSHDTISNLYYATITDMKNPNTQYERNTEIISTQYPCDTQIAISVDMHDKTMLRYDYHRLFIRDNSYNDKTTFQAAMQGVMLVYPLATPIEYDLTPQQVMMLLGDNNIWCDTGDTTLEYKVDLGRYIAKLQASQTTPQLSLSRQAVSLDAARDETTQNEDEAGDLR